MQADEWVTRWNSEMFPTLICLHIIVHLVPLLVNQELARVINETHTLDVTTLVVLTDVDIANPLWVTEHMLHVVLCACVACTNIRTWYVISEVHPQTKQMLTCTDFNANQSNLFLQVKVLQLGDSWPLEPVLIAWTKGLQLFDLGHPELSSLVEHVTPDWRLWDDLCSVCWNRWSLSHNGLGTALQDLTTTEVTLARRCLLTFGSSCQSLVKLLWLGEINYSAVRSL